MTEKMSWPGWQTVGVLGKGTYGTVYEIQREAAGRIEKAALKVIPIPQNAGTLEQLRREGNDDNSIAATLEGYAVNIALACSKVQQLGMAEGVVSCDGVNYIRNENGIGGNLLLKMELLTPLTRSLDRDVSEATVIKIGRELSETLALCHNNGMIHGAIKPGNIFVSPDGRYKLGDIGIAVAVQKTMGCALGSDPYLAPEIYAGQPAGVSTDIYALGVVLYSLLNRGKLPMYSGDSFSAPEMGSQALKEVVLKACAVNPANRFASAKQLAEALEGLDTHPAEIQIRFLLPEGKVISSRTYQPGERVEIPPIENEIEHNGVKRVFRGWSAEVEPVATKSVDYVALYETVSSGSVPETNAGGGKTGTKRNPLDAKLLVAIVASVVALALLIVLLTRLGDNKQSGDDPAPPQNFTQGSWDPTTPPAADDDVAQVFGCSHDWMPATCSAPQSCSKCGEAQGSAMGHDWEMATRANPKTCRICGITEGAPLPPPDVSVSDQVAWISDEFYAIDDMLDNDQLYMEEVRREVYYFYDDYGDVRLAVTAKGNDGIGEYSSQYRRYYYFSNDQLIFAYFEGQDYHRMYFHNQELMRWTYQGVGKSKSEAVDEIFTYSDEFLKWERLALQEAASFGLI